MSSDSVTECSTGISLENNYRWRLLVLISKYVFAKRLPDYFVLYLLIKFLQWYTKYRVYKVKYISKTCFEKSLLLNLNALDFDINNTVFVSKRLKTYQYARIRLRENTFRTVNIHSVDFCTDDSIVVNDALIYNENFSYQKDSLVALLKPIDYGKILIATDIEISFVNSPHELSQFYLDNIIKNFFIKPKLVISGDLIAIDLSIFGKETKQNHMSKYVYIKCVEIFVKNKTYYNGVFCVTGLTNIRQKVDIQSFIFPRYDLLCMCDNHNLLVKENTLEEYFTEISLMVKPFIKSMCQINDKELKINPIFLIRGVQGVGKEHLVHSVSEKFGLHFFKIPHSEICAVVPAQNETKLNNILLKAKLAAPCLIYFSNFENFGFDDNGMYDERVIENFVQEVSLVFENPTFPIIVFCATTKEIKSNELNSLFLNVININLPNPQERVQHLRSILESNKLITEIDLNGVSESCSGFAFSDLKALVYYASQKSKNRGSLSDENFEQGLDYMHKSYNESLGAPTVPKVQWSDVGGLEDIKNEITRTISLPLKHPQMLTQSGLKVSGLLLYGPPGTGKTLLAKAVATECKLCFLSVKGPELLNMYIGQSEANVREIFICARQAAPCVIFFDELDSLAPNRGVSGDSGGVMDRVVSQLLAEMDSLKQNANIFIIGATNRPDLLDTALLRPGRFDKLLYVGPSKSKVSVLKALTRKFSLAEDVDLEKIGEQCGEGVSGADMYSICASAWTNAVRRVINETDEKCISELTSRSITVNLNDFLSALKSVKFSISEKDLKYFESLNRELNSKS